MLHSSTNQLCICCVLGRGFGKFFRVLTPSTPSPSLIMLIRNIAKRTLGINIYRLHEITAQC